MADPRVTHLRGVELDVTDLAASTAFYRNVWGLEEVSNANGVARLRGGGVEHHILTLHEKPRAALHSMDFAARDRAAVDGLHAKAAAEGVEILTKPAERDAIAGGGYGFSVRTPEGQTLAISSDTRRHEEAYNDRSKPTKLSHIVLNVADIEKQGRFFKDILGFRHSDSTAHMDFVRCSADHHSIALARGHGPGLNHMAYEVGNFDGLMRGAGRLKKNGYDMAWGVGRHGPGNNIFSYFIEPNGFVTEYTTEVDQIDEATHVPGTPDYWAKVMGGNPDRWGMTTQSAALKDGMLGKTVEAHNLRCEEIMAARRRAG
jgi:catechol 2,3-dioxygenase